MNPDFGEVTITRETVLSALQKIEHPEISLSLADLGMIIDVALGGKTVRVALALPKLDIPAAVYEALTNRVKESLQKTGLDIQPEYFEMTSKNRERFFTLARANWKGAL